MAMYEMKVKVYDVDTMEFSYEWSGMELFEADNIEDALDDALESERAEHITVHGHIYVSTSAAFNKIWTDREPGHGYVAWTCIDDEGEHNMIEGIEMVEVKEGE